MYLDSFFLFGRLGKANGRRKMEKKKTFSLDFRNFSFFFGGEGERHCRCV